MKTIIKWTGEMAFSGSTPSGHVIKMDSAKEVGGQNSGARPTELLLHSLAGCTGIDIVMILKKMRFEPITFQIEIEGSRAENHPKRFTDYHIHYLLEGELPEDKVVRAIKLSKDTYCSVYHSLNANIEVSYSINGVKGNQKL
ncbi:OsmC family protein [Peribacillus butanolivorans]|uniref:Peroxiredoxin n=1 Tax=Peribacillus butanolivorans TaxID=421767 RepID=A0AAX0RRX3_9BACI|nr:OsmC family protein [Peribacillus butanolivorans]AXN41400.1 OsmC family peroxiredoxin [Peribacillus butanolivorans]PEJ32855.1 peroxiredoxin [Peribacillus butanolivorans]QNU04762.1 OsmC family protein [Peribacillus butanolivorans]